jgi:hypothetical protein
VIALSQLSDGLRVFASVANLSGRGNLEQEVIAIPLRNAKLVRRDIEPDARRTFEGLFVGLFAGLLLWSAVALAAALWTVVTTSY